MENSAESHGMFVERAAVMYMLSYHMIMMDTSLILFFIILLEHGLSIFGRFGRVCC